jgi:hypothetical protein
VNLAVNEAHEHLGKAVCEDCCIELLSVLKPCDPWAVHCAKSSLTATGGAGRLTELQTAILRELKATGGLEPQALADRLGVSLPELEREAASLRHMEKLRATLRHGRKILCCW